jgi:hypothetical protein
MESNASEAGDFGQRCELGRQQCHGGVSSSVYSGGRRTEAEIHHTIHTDRLMFLPLPCPDFPPLTCGLHSWWPPAVSNSNGKVGNVKRSPSPHDRDKEE